MATILLVQVALPLAVSKTFTYSVPPELRETLLPGHRVLVPLGNRRVSGYVVEAFEGPQQEGLKPVLEIMDECPLFPPSLIPFFQWISDYYLHPLGMVIKTALPPGLEVKSGHDFVLAAPVPQDREDFQGTDLEWSVLQAMKNEGALSPRDPLPGKGKAGFMGALRSLEQKGYLRRRVWVRNRGVQPRRIKFVQALPLGREGRSGLTSRQLEVLEYIESRGTVSLKELASTLPGSDQVVRRMEKKGLLKTSLHRVYRTPLGDDIPLDGAPPVLTPDQEKVFQRIRQALDRETYHPFLLHGVTGSGKTEVYMRAIAHVLAQGGSALVLVPEISLSLAMEGLFRSRFGAELALIHSGLSRGELYDQWIRIASGRTSLVLGARSAVFAPLERPRLIVVDEEHDPSYKQDQRLRYHARDLALVRGKMAEAVVILGSATPCFRTYKNVVRGKIGYLSLPRRVYNRPLPRVNIVDMRKEPHKGYLSGTLVRAMRANLERGEQTVLFLNRRGYAPIVLCPSCGQVLGCPSCQISLTYHRGEARLLCHYCGHGQPLPPACPSCGSSALIPLGWGTEKLEKEVQNLFPEARVARLDSDVASARRELFYLLRELRRGNIDILVGTQMVTKGHHFPNVTLVGVLAAEQSLHFPDFGASERTFQLLAQVSGRAGRGAKPGQVIIQTYNPRHYSIVQAQSHNFHAFYLQEIVGRHRFHYPPFSRLAVLHLSGRDPQQTARMAFLAGQAVRSCLKQAPGRARVLGPAPSPVARIKDRYRWQVLVMADSPARLNHLARSTLEALGGRPRRYGVKVAVDVDPVSIL